MEQRKEHSEWKVGRTSCGEKTFYPVYRLIDKSGAGWRGNRETRGIYDNILDAEKLVEKLNAEGKKWTQDK